MKLASGVLALALLCAVRPVRGQSMVEMKHAAQRDFEKADAELNTLYKNVLSGLDPKGSAALRESQRAWVIVRDKTAEAYGTGEEGGSLEWLMYIRYQEAATQDRTRELKKLFQSDHYPY